MSDVTPTNIGTGQTERLSAEPDQEGPSWLSSQNFLGLCPIALSNEVPAQLYEKRNPDLVYFLFEFASLSLSVFIINKGTTLLENNGHSWDNLLIHHLFFHIFLHYSDSRGQKISTNQIA